MRADVERRIVEYLLLHELALFVLVHLAFEEVEGSAVLLHLDGLALPLLLLEDRTQVAVLPVVFAALHRSVKLYTTCGSHLLPLVAGDVDQRVLLHQALHRRLEEAARLQQVQNHSTGEVDGGVVDLERLLYGLHGDGVAIVHSFALGLEGGE